MQRESSRSQNRKLDEQELDEQLFQDAEVSYLQEFRNKCA